MNKWVGFGIGALCLAIIYFAFSTSEEVVPDALLPNQEPDQLRVPLGLPPVVWPADNPYNKKKADLGQLLYFDKRLSSDGTISCGTCHRIPRAFTDNRPIAQGIEGQLGTRHTPTVINAAYLKTLFWDGRADSLEAQAKGPLGNPKEMTLAASVHDAHVECRERICKIKGYQVLFEEVFGDDACTIENIAKAIATFERTILSGNSAFDRYMAGDKTAMTAQQLHGYEVFKRAQCINCHREPNFDDRRFLNIGIGMDQENPDLGRYEITDQPEDWGAFKIPPLREIEHTYPYMHNGSLPTLEAVVDYYDRGGNPNRNLNRLMKPLHLTVEEKADLVSFLKALSGEGWQHFKEPSQFPE